MRRAIEVFRLLAHNELLLTLAETEALQVLALPGSPGFLGVVTETVPVPGSSVAGSQA